MRRLSRALMHCASEAWDGLWRNPGLSLLSAASIGVSLYVLGVFLLLAFNLNLFVDALGREAQVQIYLKSNAAPEDVERLRAELSTDPAIASARHLSSEEARKRFQETFPTLRDLSQRIGGDPFPASFELEMREGYRDRDALDRIVK